MTNHGMIRITTALFLLVYSTLSPVPFTWANEQILNSVVEFQAVPTVPVETISTDQIPKDVKAATNKFLNEGPLSEASSDVTAPVITSSWLKNVTSTGAMIKWTTDENANSQVEYWITASDLRTSPLDSNLTLTHRVSISGLSTATTYNYRIKTCDGATPSNCTYSQNYSLTTLASDTTAPVLNNISVLNVTSDSVTVTWTTDTLSNSRIRYGLTASSYDLFAKDPTGVTNHSLTLSNLNPNTTYYYQVTSCNVEKCTTSAALTFTTKSLDATAPVISNVTLSNIQSTSAAISWTTNELSDTQIRYGTTSSNLNLSTTLNETDTLSHSQTLTNLQANTTYYYQVLSKDAAGNLTVSTVSSFKTAANTTTSKPPTGEVYVSTIDGDFNRVGHQVFQASAYDESIVTYSSNLSDPEGALVSWQWLYTYNGGTEVLLSKGTGIVANMTMNFQTRPAGTYNVILRASDGVNSTDVVMTTEVIAGSWKDYYNPPLNSNYIFLDFNGTYLSQWGGYYSVSTPAFSTDKYTGFSATEMTSIAQIFWGVIEKYSPFNVFVSLFDLFMPSASYATQAQEFSARNSYYEGNDVLQVSIGGSGSWYGSAGGVAYVNSFNSSSQNTVFVFPGKLSNSVKYITVAAVHEAGHAFGLRHQAEYDSSGKQIKPYYYGTDGKAPLMGVAYYQPRGLWWYGKDDYGRIQDDMAMLASTLGYRGDDHGNSTNSASAFTVLGTQLTASGIIGQMTDVDYFKFTLPTSGQVSFTLNVAKYEAMLDASIEIRDANNNLITSRATTSVGETISNFTLNAGTYYFVVKSNGSYGDVGQYFVTATVPAGTTSTRGSQAIVTTTTTASYSSSKNTAAFLAATPETIEEFLEEV